MYTRYMSVGKGALELEERVYSWQNLEKVFIFGGKKKSQTLNSFPFSPFKKESNAFGCMCL